MHAYTHTHTIGVGLPPSQDRIDAISGELRDIKKSPSLCSLKAIATQLREIKETNELAQHTLSHSLDLQEMHSLELKEMKASLLSLESIVKKLFDKSDVGIPNDDVIDVDSFLSSFSSNPPLTESSGTLSLPQSKVHSGITHKMQVIR